jgi:hypothetical protein
MVYLKFANRAHSLVDGESGALLFQNVEKLIGENYE